MLLDFSLSEIVQLSHDLLELIRVHNFFLVQDCWTEVLLVLELINLVLWVKLDFRVLVPIFSS